MNQETAQRLWAGCAALGIGLDAGQKERFLAFDALLAETNAVLDLTAVLEPGEAVDRHYLDSLTPLRGGEGRVPRGARIIDVGAGAGFPGIPLAIVRPDVSVTLLDAQRKRVVFLQRAVEALGLGSRAQAIHARAEDAARLPGHRQSYDLAVSRAVAGLPALLELTLPFVRTGGSALAWKGPAALDELDAASRAATLLGGRLCPPEAAPVPGRDWNHLLITAVKVAETVRQYPRKAGLPVHKPLGTVP